MWALSAAVSFQGLMTLSIRSITLPPRGNLLLRGVIVQLVALGRCEDAEEGRIAVRCPMAEGKTSNEYGDTREDRIEEIERPHCADAYEVEKRPFHPQVGERLVQALEDSICTVFLLCFVWHDSLY